MIIGGSLQIGQVLAFSPGGSLSFNGSNQYLSVSNSAGAPLGSGAFTIECWFYQTAIGANPNSLIFMWKAANGRAFQLYTGNSLGAGWNTSGGMGGGVTTTNTWYHGAFVSNGTNFYLYLNGQQVATAAAVSISASSDPVIIGANNDSASPVWNYNGYITNVRIVKGTAVYTGNFTPSSQPLTSVTNTSLLLTASTSGSALTDSSINNFSISNGNGVAYSSSTPFTSVVPAVMRIGSFSIPMDIYFSYVTLLLSGDGTNGAQNNTFVDSSTNNFTITRNGTPTQGSLSPYGNNWSNYFNGTTDYFTSPNSTAITFGSGDFTIEAWVYTTVLNGENGIFGKREVGQAIGAIFRVLNTTNKLTMQIANATGSAWAIDSPDSGLPALTLNTWYHVALVRSGSSFTIYQNGVAGTTYTYSGTITDNTSPGYIGKSDGSAGNQYWHGYISNFRIVKGTAVYTTAFTPPTAPLTARANTSLLTCRSNRVVDNSTSTFALTVSGTLTVQRFSPFSMGSAYSTSVIGGSGYFAITGSYLDFTNTNNQIGFGTGDFTIESWVYFYNPTSTTTYNVIFRNYNADPFVTDYFYFGKHASATVPGAVSFWVANYAGSLMLSDPSLPSAGWNHFAVVRNGNTWTMYRNGTGVHSVTSSVSMGTRNNNICQIGVDLAGNISNLRVVKGTAVYTANFTPSTTPLTAIANTSLLCNFTNAGVVDNAMMSNLVTVGNAQVGTAQSKFGGASMYFDGTGDSLNISNNYSGIFGTGNFTVEAWVYTTVSSGTQCVYDTRQTDATATGFFFGLYTTNILLFYTSGAVTINAGTVPANTWTHIALVRVGNTFTIYLNGTSVGSATNTNSFTNTVVQIGASDTVTSSSVNYFNGYIDDLRITNGIARYTSNFTAPTTSSLTQ